MSKSYSIAAGIFALAIAGCMFPIVVGYSVLATVSSVLAIFALRRIHHAQ